MSVFNAADGFRAGVPLSHTAAVRSVDGKVWFQNRTAGSRDHPRSCALASLRSSAPIHLNDIVSMRRTPSFNEHVPWQFNVLALKYSENNAGILDDYPDHSFSVWGVYATRHIHRNEVPALDLYYLGIDHKRSTFQAGSGREQRQAVGLRFAGVRGNWDHDSEAIFQFGDFASRPIRAWTATTNSGYTFRPRQKIEYRVGLDSSIASGNHNPTKGAFGTFNALLPKGAYFGEANFIGPHNIQVVRPSVRVTIPRKRVVIWPNFEVLWRQSRQDGVYSIPAILVRAGSTADAMYVGSQADLNIEWEQNRHLTWRGDGEHFFSGTFLHQTTSGKSVDYFSPGVAYRF